MSDPVDFQSVTSADSALTNEATSFKMNAENFRNIMSDMTVTTEVDLMTDEMEEAFDEAMSMLDNIMNAATEEDGPSFSIDGVGLASGTSPIGTEAQTGATTVSIVSDSADGKLSELVMQSVEGYPPVILSTIKFPLVDTEGMLEAIKLNQIERQIVKETVDSGLTIISETDPDGLYTALLEENDLEKIRIAGMIAALSELQTQANVAASGLDLNAMSSQIMSLANDKLLEIVQPTETNNPSLPAGVEDFLSPTMEEDHFSSNSYTNTAKIITLTQNMLNGAMSCYPTVLSGIYRRNDMGNTLHSPPSPVYYGTTGKNPDNIQIPTCHKAFRKNNYSIISRFVKNHFGTASTHANTRISSTQSDNLLHHYSENSRNTQAQWDYVNWLICLLSNELIMSSGVGRLKGGSLGERFIMSEAVPQDDSTAPPQTFSKTNPFHRLFGQDPGLPLQTRVYQSGGAYPGGILDYLSLGEEVDDEKFVVMPFEVNTAKLPETASGVVLVSGRKYFIDVALQDVSSEQPDRSSLKVFADQYSAFTSDISSYMTELLALDQETSLAPELMLARILQDFKAVLQNASTASSVRDILSDAAAGFFMHAGGVCRAEEHLRCQTGDVNFRDVLRGCVIKALKSLDTALEDSSFKMSTTKTEYDVAANYTDGAPPEGTVFFDSMLKQCLATYAGYDMASGIRQPGSSTFTSALPNIESFTAVADRAGAGPRMFGLEEMPTILNVGEYETFDLHDSTWASSSNLVCNIARTIREFQAEALNLATRDAAESDYRSESGETHLSGMDEDRFISVMVNLYSEIASLLLPGGSFAVCPTDKAGARDRIATFEGEAGHILTFWDSAAVNASLGIVSKVIDSLANGAVINDTIYETTGIAEITQINKHSASVIDSESRLPYFPQIFDQEATVGNLVEAASRISNHRYNIKATLKILETIASCVNESSASLTEIFNILDGNIETTDDLTETQLFLYEMFQTQEGKESPIKSSISEQQNNLNCLAYQTIKQQDEEDPLFFRSDTYLSKSERLALNDYVRQVYGSQHGNDNIHILTVGLPTGLIEAVTRPSYTIGDEHAQASGTTLSQEAFNEISSSSSATSSILRFRVNRYEEVYSSAGSSLPGMVEDVVPNLKIDPEIFILPNSIRYDPDNPVEMVGAGGTALPDTSFKRIFSSTMFYRIRGGTVVEEIDGANIVDQDTLSAAQTCLVSYLLDLWMYETAQVRYYDSACVNGIPHLTDAGYEFLSAVSNNTQMCMSIASRKNFINLFDSDTKMLKSSEKLTALLTSPMPGIPPEHSVTDLYTAGYLSLIPMFTKNDSIVRTRPYERIYSFLYDEKIARADHVQQPDPSASSWLAGNQPPSIEQRSGYDGFSLRVSVERVASSGE